MTDRERFKAFFDEYGIGYIEDDPIAPPNTLFMKAQEQANVDGYMDFYAGFLFNEHGEFEKVMLGE